MNPLRWMFQFAVGCHHGHLSRVFTIKKRTYKVCLNCGEEFPYHQTPIPGAVILSLPDLPIEKLLSPGPLEAITALREIAEGD
jgi:hypothetical protein